MKQLFLCSLFSEVVPLFADFTNNDFKNKRVTFIATANIPERTSSYVKAAKKWFKKLGLKVDELDISKASSKEISEKLSRNDYIYVSGGNTFFLLQEMQRSGTDSKITEQVNAGKIYIGESAGAIIISPNIRYVTEMDNPDKAPHRINDNGLNLINFYPLPHHGEPAFKQVINSILSTYQNTIPLYPISNSQVIRVSGKEVKVLSKRI